MSLQFTTVMAGVGIPFKADGQVILKEFSAITTITADTTLVAADVGKLILCSTTATTFTIYLPAASSVVMGGSIKIKNATGGTKTVSRSGADLLISTSAATPVVSTTAGANGASLTLVSNGVDRWVVL